MPQSNFTPTASFRWAAPLLPAVAIACVVSSVWLALNTTVFAQSAMTTQETVFSIKDGMGAVEAEHFYSQTETDKRAFYLTSSETTPEFDPDGDPPHVGGASNGAYLEILPDSRRNHSEKLIPGTNFSNTPGGLGILTYRVNFDAPGKYYVWVRAHSTGSEDNGLHVGIDGTWPESGRRMQWCTGKRTWHWESKQRTEEVHCGEPYKIFLDVTEAGDHDVHFSMREDGFEFDKFILTTEREFARPDGVGPAPVVHAGPAAKAFTFVAAKPAPDKVKPTPDANANKAKPKPKQASAKELIMRASSYELDGTGFYLHNGKWAAVNPEQHKKGSAGKTFEYPTGRYNVTFEAVGESDGSSTYTVQADNDKIGDFTCPISQQTFEAGPKYHKTWNNVLITEGAIIRIIANIASADGMEYSRARWEAVRFEPADAETVAAAKPFLADQPSRGTVAKASKNAERDLTTSPTKAVSSADKIEPRQADGTGEIATTGELMAWHPVTVTLDGPFAHEQDNVPNPFLDYAFNVTFTHSDGTKYRVPGYFAADGDASETSAESGTKWRAHFTPDRAGKWTFTTEFAAGKDVAIDASADSKPVADFDGKTGQLKILASTAPTESFRSKGRLQHVGERYLRHAGSNEIFVKAGADAPETMLGYADFDGTIAGKADKVPLKTWQPHVQDWNAGDPTWKDGKGKGLIGAINYLSGKGCNAFSFLTYNAGGDGDNVWPFIDRDDKLHYDCSKLDQWSIVFDHGTDRNMYLHFKMQETENDDHNIHSKGNDRNGYKPESLDGGNLGPQRKLYCRELVARFAHNLALNWNLGEENTQSTLQIQAMVDYIADLDTYDHQIVLHTFPNQQDKQYRPLLGSKSQLTGLSLQNSGIKDTHWQTVKWVKESTKAGKPWIVAFDESGTAAHGQCPDIGYKGFDGRDRTGKMIYDENTVRRQTLWGHFMGGGAGVEYYFGYQFAENDLVCEDWRSRDRSWDYCRVALEFFRKPEIDIASMQPADELVGNTKTDGSDEANAKYCMANPGESYLVYLATAVETSLDLSDAKGDFEVFAYSPRTGGDLQPMSLIVQGGSEVTLKAPLPADTSTPEDWLLVVLKK